MLSQDDQIGRDSMNVIVITKSAGEFRKAFSSLVTGSSFKIFDSSEQGLANWRAEKSELIFCDTTMPDISGFRIAKTIANEKGDHAADVYLMSRNVNEADVLWAKKQGASGVIECNSAVVSKIIITCHQARPFSTTRDEAENVDMASLNEIDEALCKELGPVAFILSEEARALLATKNTLTPGAYATHLARNIQNSAGRQRFLDQFLDQEKIVRDR